MAIKQCLTHSTVFQIQISQIHILLNKTIVRPITVIDHTVTPCYRFLLQGGFLLLSRGIVTKVPLNSYKETFNCGGLQIMKLSPLLSWGEVSQHAGSNGGEGVKSAIS